MKQPDRPWPAAVTCCSCHAPPESSCFFRRSAPIQPAAVLYTPAYQEVRGNMRKKSHGACSRLHAPHACPDPHPKSQNATEGRLNARERLPIHSGIIYTMCIKKARSRANQGTYMAFPVSAQPEKTDRQDRNRKTHCESRGT